MSILEWFRDEKIEPEAVVDEPCQKEETKSSWWKKPLRHKDNHSVQEYMEEVEAENNKLRESFGLDSGFQNDSVGTSSMSPTIASWFVNNGRFIGYQMCGVLAQNWLINKVCKIPADDAVKNWFRVINYNGNDVDDRLLTVIKKYDKKLKLRKNLSEFVYFGRVFGVRVAIFDIETDDPEFYEKPFDINKVGKNAYKGIIQVDPLWMTPAFNNKDISDPINKNFYEPTYYNIKGKLYHRSHLVIYKYIEPADYLKPMYQYGGISLPQVIADRVYTAERVADEVLGLVTTKRTTVWKTDMSAFMADLDSGANRIKQWSQARDNYGIKVGSVEDDDFQQFDTSLSGLSEIVFENYKIIASCANVPITKLFGYSPSGFSTGEMEMKNYYEEIQRIQENELTDFVERHHQLILKSYCDTTDENITIDWNPLDAPTHKEIAETNAIKVQTYATLVSSGVLSAEEVREVLGSDEDFNVDLGGLENTIDEDEKILQELLNE